MRVINKMQRSGGAYYVNLPTKWIKDRKIYKGDFMNITTMDDGSIVIKPLEEKKPDGNSQRPSR